MKLRNKIALTFILLSSGTLFVVCLFIYLFIARNTRQDFLRRLNERAEIAAVAFLEKDELSQRIYDEIIGKHFKKLPKEQEYFIRIDETDPDAPTLPNEVTDVFLDRVNEKERAETKVGTMSIAGIFYEDNQGTYLVIVTAEDESGARVLANLRLAFLVIFLVYIVAVALISIWFSKDILGPIARIIEKMEDINTSNLHLRLDIDRRSKDELSRMIQTFNSMLDRLETSIEAQNQFISNASHELKNPLTSILGEVELALAKPHDAAYLQEAVENIEEEATRMQHILLRLLKLAQTSGSQPEKFFTEVRADELLMDILEEIHELNPEKQYRLELDALPDDPQQLVIQANRPLLRIALTNVIENAYKFSENKPVTVVPAVMKDEIKIAVTDKGEGISAEDFPYIFDPFFRSETARHLPGYGIGLAMVQKIVRLHDGTIEVFSKPGKGATFVFRLPRRTAQAAGSQ